MCKIFNKVLKSLLNNNENDIIITPISGNTDNSQDNIIMGSIPSFKSDVKILVDNGHGYDTPGKMSPYSATKVKPAIDFYEWKWNREISCIIVERLQKEGYDAELLVTEEHDISLSERVKRVNKICNELGKDKVILISVHANAAGNGTSWLNAKGWAGYTSKGQTKSDKMADIFYKNAERLFPDRQIRKDLQDKDPDWEANFTVIYKTYCAAILTENFFYDNVDDVEFILSEEGREKVIELHVSSIIEYLGTL
jgi:N-acetylmuramoyl-L-alanine amidase